ncbi:MAG TPA: hypothetical protein VK673_01310 [Chthoniobacterales bacterium]|nr:hypothetical protein [Chthoniobacterales bacterium]
MGHRLSQPHRQRQDQHVRQPTAGNYYVYADPAHYQIFVGTPSQYQKYQQLRLANNLVQDQLELPS